MQPVKSMIVLALAGLLAGCGGCGQSPPDRLEPLTVEQWKALPVEKKYEPETLDRLKAADPSLDTPEGWEKFNRTVVVPSRKKDFPGGKPRR